MLNSNGFDLWASGYDEYVCVSDEADRYPFAGYREISRKIFQIITKTPNADVLDIGFGTGVLTKKLYDSGCSVFGQDFSSEMIRLAHDKMPNAHLYQKDFSQGLAAPLLSREYDFIVAAYSLHHLPDKQKISFLRDLRKLLKANGIIVIGDVAFENRTLLEECRKEVGCGWDGDEFYFVVDELRPAFPDMSFIKVSHCAGIITLNR